MGNEDFGDDFEYSRAFNGMSQQSINGIYTELDARRMEILSHNGRKAFVSPGVCYGVEMG